MTWTPIISSTFFDGVRADMLVSVGGILGLALIIFGLAMLMMFRLSWKWTFKLFALRGYGEPYYLPLG